MFNIGNITFKTGVNNYCTFFEICYSLIPLKADFAQFKNEWFLWFNRTTFYLLERVCISFLCIKVLLQSKQNTFLVFTAIGMDIIR